MIRALLAIAMLLLMPNPALAEDANLVERFPGHGVRLWRSPQAYEAAQAGKPIEPECEASTGTPVLVERVPASWAWRATITVGPNAGCSGVVSPTDFTTAGDARRERWRREDAARQEAARRAREAAEKRPAVDSNRVSRGCGKELLIADQLVKEAWRDYGKKKELGSYLSAECRAEIQAVDERTKNQQRGK